MLSPQQVAEAVGLSRDAVYRAIGRGDLAALKLCGRLRVDPGEVAAWKVRCQVEPRKPDPPKLPPPSRPGRQAVRFPIRPPQTR